MSDGRRRSLLLIMDMLSDYGFPDADRVLDGAEPAVASLRRARDFADEFATAVAYANDVEDRWQCSRSEACGRALRGRRPDLVEPLLPRARDWFIHKGQHSAFYGTPLPHMLRQEEIEELVIGGQVAEQCVLYTALDAYMRHYQVIVLSDAVLALDDELGGAALRMMERNMGARILTTDQWRES